MSSAFDALIISLLVMETFLLPLRECIYAAELCLGETGAVSNIPDCCVKANVVPSSSFDVLVKKVLSNLWAEMVAGL